MNFTMFFYPHHVFFPNGKPSHKSATPGSDRKKLKMGSPTKKSKSSPTSKKRKAVLKPRDAVESDPPSPKELKKHRKRRKEALKKVQEMFFHKFGVFSVFFFVGAKFGGGGHCFVLSLGTEEWEFGRKAVLMWNSHVWHFLIGTKLYCRDIVGKLDISHVLNLPCGNWSVFYTQTNNVRKRWSLSCCIKLWTLTLFITFLPSLSSGFRKKSRKRATEMLRWSNLRPVPASRPAPGLVVAHFSICCQHKGE